MAQLSEDCFAIVGGDPGFEADFQAPGVARFDGDTKVGADFFAPVSGFGGMVCFDLDGSYDRAARVYDRLKIIRRAASLGA